MKEFEQLIIAGADFYRHLSAFCEKCENSPRSDFVMDIAYTIDEKFLNIIELLGDCGRALAIQALYRDKNAEDIHNSFMKKKLKEQAK